MDFVAEEWREENSSAKIFIPEEWENAAASITSNSVTSQPSITLVCGPKNSGKSTFSRHLVNVLLQRYKKVVYLDTDVGQAEFTPPGLLSLITIDNITHDMTIASLKTPERCFFFGDTSSKTNPTMYLTCIKELYDFYCKEYCKVDSVGPNIAVLPLVINTPGWVKGIGYEILVDMIKYTSPTYVVKICISAETKNLPAGKFWLDEDSCKTTALIEVNSARQDAFNRSVLIHKDANFLRDMRVMAYFRQCFPSDREINDIKELAQALAAHPPYRISVASVTIKNLHCQVPHTEIFYSLNATIVGLAVSSKDSRDLPDCVGLGIVRAVDTFKGMLYIITPVPHNSLVKVDVLLQGFVRIPPCLLQVQGCVSPYMSEYVLSEDQICTSSL